MVWNSLIPTPLLSIPFCIFVVCVCVFSCVPLISSDLMDEDGRCPADYQSRQMKAEAGRQLAGVFYQTLLRWIPTVSMCVVLYVSICLRLLKTGAASCFTEREYFSLTDICSVWSFTHTHTHTHVLLCAFHGHCSEWWQELIASEFSTGQQTHTSVAGGVNAHTEKKTLLMWWIRINPMPSQVEGVRPSAQGQEANTPVQ